MKMNFKLPAALRSLKHRNYRLFFAGQAVSQTGSWMQMIAMSWLIYRMTDSAFLLGLVGFTGQIPVFFITPFAGVLADRCSRYKTIIITQALSMLHAFILAWLTLSGRITITQIIVLSLFQGLIQSLETPTRHSFVVEMLEDRSDLSNAIALNSFIFNMSRLLGPAMGGFLIRFFGEGLCFFINAISFIAVLAAFAMMKTAPFIPAPVKKGVLSEFLSGFKYIRESFVIRTLLIMLSCISAMGLSYRTLLPVYVKEILHMNADTFGILMSAMGAGAVCGVVFLASRKSLQFFPRHIQIASGLIGTGLILFSINTSFYISLLLMSFLGFSMILQVVSTNTMVQTVSEDTMRGRIMGFYTLSLMGMMPLGSLIAGILIRYTGISRTFLVSGIVCLGASVLYSAEIRQIKSHLLDN